LRTLISFDGACSSVPIRVSSAIEISATSQLVWGVFTDIHRWSDWNPLIIEVTSVSGGTIWAPGGAFVMRYKSEFTPIQAIYSLVRTAGPAGKEDCVKWRCIRFERDHNV